MMMAALHHQLGRNNRPIYAKENQYNTHHCILSNGQIGHAGDPGFGYSYRC